MSSRRYAAPVAGPHGGDGARLAAALGIAPSEVLDLSASLNPVAPDPAPIVAAHLDALGRYPDPSHATDALAAEMGVDPGRLLLTNGGAEAIALVGEDQVKGSVDEPEFSLYRRHLAAVGPEWPRWRSNPHNPSGRLANPTDEAAVWDEAFWPLATGTWTRGDADRGSVIVGSLTKLLACPGLRIGYVLCPDHETKTRLQRRQPQWALNGLAAASLPAFLERVELRQWSEEVTKLRKQLVATLRRAGFEPQPSDANWVLVQAPDLREHLALRAIAVRDCASFGLPGTVRIAVPSAEDLDRLREAL